MPCWAITYQELELKAANRELLVKAIEALGGQVASREQALNKSQPLQFRAKRSYNWSTIKGSTVTAADDRATGPFVAELRREYSRQVLQQAGKMLRWNVKQTGPRTLQAQRRF